MARREFLPPFLREKYKELKEHPELNDRCEKIADFLWLIDCIWCISNADYQKRIWVKYEILDIVDSYDDTIMYFCEDSEAILEARDEGRVTMTDKQYNMLKKLFHLVDDYDISDARPESDRDIVNSPEWHKIREYAKLVYEELIKEK